MSNTEKRSCKNSTAPAVDKILRLSKQKIIKTEISLQKKKIQKNFPLLFCTIKKIDLAGHSSLSFGRSKEFF